MGIFYNFQGTTIRILLENGTMNNGALHVAFFLLQSEIGCTFAQHLRYNAEHRVLTKQNTKDYAEHTNCNQSYYGRYGADDPKTKAAEADR